MKKLIICFIAGALSSGILFAKNYTVDMAHSQVEFKIKHLSVSNVTGNFSKFDGTLSVENGALTALNGEVDVDSINTNNETRDSHIKDEEYFNVSKFPKATIKLVKMNGTEGVFDITIKGITRQITLEVDIFGTSKNQAGVEVVGLNLSGKINRKDFDIAKSSSNAALGEEVKISIDIEGKSE